MTSLLIGAAVVAAGLWLRNPQRLLRIEFARQRLSAGARVKRAALPDGEVVYLEAGRGTPVLYVHGFTGMKENWLPLIATMGATHTHIAPDLPGWGESQRYATHDYGYAAQADRLARFIDTCIGGPVDVVGHSMGGGIAAVLAARHPARVKRLVLMDAAGVRFTDNAFGLDVMQGRNPFAVDDEASLTRFLSLVFERPPWVPKRIARYMVTQRIGDAEFEQCVLDAIGRSEDAFLPEREAGNIRAPTLLLWCRGDRVVDASAAEIYASRIPRNHVVMLDGSSHMPMYECKVATAVALKEFLA
ncbi:alpha/beta fold hydrolase [Xanthomonadaceae bacterium JHOS43]|nr:alpha/beta fold hydrolase [Xanthomonadaceae bacterium JHOS43]